MFKLMKLVLATHNNHKKAELNSILSSLEISVVGLDEYPEISEIEETGSTLFENAFLKARTVHRITGLPSLADDTGLEVDALNGAPGVYSARFASENPSYEENINKLLSVMLDIPVKNRTARFRTVMAFVDSDVELSAEGFIKGVITTTVRGENGFGYDPVFQPKRSKITFAEMSDEEKNRISHRARALENLGTQLKPYFDKGGNIE